MLRNIECELMVEITR